MLYNETVSNSTYSIKSFIITMVCNKELSIWSTVTISNSTYSIKSFKTTTFCSKELGQSIIQINYGIKCHLAWYSVQIAVCNYLTLLATIIFIKVKQHLLWHNPKIRGPLAGEDVDLSTITLCMFGLGNVQGA